MPTILRIGSYRFFFYSGDHGEPIHVHVERESNLAKVWVDPVRLQSRGGLLVMGRGVHWMDIDEDISVQGIISRIPSGENQTSFKRWLESRQGS